ncbi:homoserine dehydrogenase [Eubacteriales bacterium OttesenSCG-928-M02]|nr:homoserine dehydrogenase [Eubacteriales bacterium OttesenSCG-928-M02]
MKISIGLIGCGVVGGGIVQLLKENGAYLQKRDDLTIEIKRILVRDAKKARPGVDPALLTEDIDDIINDGDISIVLEAMGGVDPGLQYAQRAMEAGKHYVTANKELIAKHWEELNAAAQRGNVSLAFEASVAGAVPILHTLNGSMHSSRITSVMGIINGTTNYILSEMTQYGAEYADVLKKAQELGYAEADPTADVEGYDATYKLCILCGLAFGARVTLTQVLREGITKVGAMDIDMAKELGYVIKLLGIGKMENGQIQARVHPAMIPVDSPLASIGGPFNGILVNGNASGELMFYGRGAGDLPTASAMVSDTINIAKGKAADLVAFSDLPVMADFLSGYYIRTMAEDRPGVMHGVSGIFAQYGVSIESCVQKGHGDGTVPLIFVTHKAKESDIKKAIQDIEKLDYITIESVIRVEK